MLTIADQSILFDFEKQEAQNPSPKKVVESGRAIYGTRRLGLPKDSLWGQPVLCDFGEARIGQVHNGLIQPELYRAPEVLFGMEWTSSADIWNVATLVSPEIFCGLHGTDLVPRSGTCSKIDIYSMLWMRITSHRRLTTSLRWCLFLGFLRWSICVVAKLHATFFTRMVSCLSI